MPSTDLPTLRAEVARADQAIRDAVERRLRLAETIGERKLALGLPVRDYAVEAEVLSWWRSALEPEGIPPERADQFARWLVEEAVRAQEKLGEGRRVSSEPTDVLIVGGAGGMGRWLGGFLRSAGHRVAILDPRAKPEELPGYEVATDLAAAVANSKVVVVATPMSAASAVYRQIVERAVSTRVLLLDVLSAKTPLVEEIRRARVKGVRVASIHPLFGPGTRVLSGRNLLVMDCGDPEAATEAAALFERSALRVSRVPLEAHDPLMAEVLALPHAISILFSVVLSRRSVRADELERSAPVSFARQAEIARIVTEENPQLSFEIQRMNPWAPELLQRIERAAVELRGAIEESEGASYRTLLTEARRFWSPATSVSHP